MILIVDVLFWFTIEEIIVYLNNFAGLKNYTLLFSEDKGSTDLKNELVEFNTWESSKSALISRCDHLTALLKYLFPFYAYNQ